MKRKLICIMAIALTTWIIRAALNPSVVEVTLTGGGLLGLDGAAKKVDLTCSGGGVRLAWTGPVGVPTDKIAVYEDAACTILISGNAKTWNPAPTAASVWVKGVKVSGALDDVHMTLEALQATGTSSGPIKFTVVRLDSIWATKPYPNERMESFPPHVAVNCSAFSIVNPGRHLPVFRNDLNHDSVLAALMMTPNMFDTYDANVSVTWRKISGPDSGDFNETDKMLVRYENPTIGGIYKLGFHFGLGTPESQVNIVLPLAGADMMTWLGSERRFIEINAPQHKAETRADCIAMNPLLAVEPLLLEWEMTASFANLSAFDFDYTMHPVNASRQAPFAHYAAQGDYWYVTISGVVVHGSKINNMLWSLFSRGWGWSETEIRAGAHLNQLARTLRLDGVSSQNALGLGFELHARYSETTSDILTEALITSMQDPLLDEEKFWPCSDPADPVDADGNAISFGRPSLRTTQYD